MTRLIFGFNCSIITITKTFNFNKIIKIRDDDFANISEIKPLFLLM